MTLKRLFCWSLVLFSALHAYAQESKKSSSYGKMKQESSVKEMNALLDQAESLKSSSPQRALELVKEALAMSLIRQDVAAEGRSYILLGEINLGIGEWGLARDNFLQAHDKLTSLKVVTVDRIAAALAGLGKSNLELGNHADALRYLNDLVALKTDRGTEVSAILEISEVYYRMGNFEDALAVLNATSRYESTLARPLRARLDNQKARIYARTNQVEESVRKFQSGQDNLRSNAGRAPQAQEQQVRAAKDEIAEVLEEQKRYDEKIELLNSSIEYNTDVKNYGELARDKVQLGNTFIAKGMTTAALRELKEAAQIADTIGDPRKQAEAFLSLAGLYQDYGDPQAALSTYRKYSKAVARSEAQSKQNLMEKADMIRTQRDIEEVSKYISISKQEEQLAQAMVFRQKLIIYGLILIILIIAVTSWFIYRNARASKIANQLLALKSLRSQMNPHFIFNALNSVNHFVAQQDERAANRFLTEFSKLMRLVLENSQEDFISLLKEEEIISLYLKLEHYRFRDKFDYEIRVDESINREMVEIPPMLIQPYIENAVWHGLRYRQTKGFLLVQMKQEGESIVVTVSDNGIGRRRSAELKTENQQKHQSTGLKNIRERLGIINRVYRCKYHVFIEDHPDDSGTTVTLHVPINRKVSAYA